MDIALIIVGAYFGIGLFALIILDVLTGRIRKTLYSASAETQSKLAVTGNYVGGKTSIVMVLGALWLFWPVAIYGAVTKSQGDNKE